MIINGDVRTILPTLPSDSVDCIVTSPPYFQLRDYGMDKQIGREDTYQSYIDELTAVFTECKRILKDTGTLFINLGDRYAEDCDIPNRNLMLLPFRLADNLIKAGYVLRNDIIWYKPNAMPSGGRVINKFTNSYEHVLFLTKKETGYFFNYSAVMEDIRESRKKCNSSGHKFGGSKYPGNISNNTYSGNEYQSTGKRLKRDMWEIPTQPYTGAHFACFPEKLVETCILSGCVAGGTVMDIFSGSGTTGKVAYDLGCEYIGIELNPEYVALSKERIGTTKQQALS